jgi:hypothetical protein
MPIFLAGANGRTGFRHAKKINRFQRMRNKEKAKPKAVIRDKVCSKASLRGSNQWSAMSVISNQKTS